VRDYADAYFICGAFEAEGYHRGGREKFEMLREEWLEG
jgi:hypothetical protein